MAKPIFHAISSAKKFGGTPEDYLPIHQLMDSSKGAMPDNRHRALTHNSWFLSVILERIFGVSLVNSVGRIIAVREIGEQHILEDFGGKFIPTAQDYLQEMDIKYWMNGMGQPVKTTEVKTIIPEAIKPIPDFVLDVPSSHKKINDKRITRPVTFD